MQVIETKYLCPTNTRGGRIRAVCAAGKITIPYPHEGNTEGAHIKAASALCLMLAERNVKLYGGALEKEPWLRPRTCGQLESGSFVHVFNA
jgi:hypothetical protein